MCLTPQDSRRGIIIGLPMRASSADSPAKEVSRWARFLCVSHFTTQVSSPQALSDIARHTRG